VSRLIAIKKESSMTTYLALLRAVNVGGKNTLPMADVRKALEAAGYERVRTYIQSGNNILDTPEEDRDMVSRKIAGLIQEQFGVTSPAVIVTRDELASALAGYPFQMGDPDEKLAHILFLAGEPNAAQIAALDPDRSPGDQFQVDGRVVYLRYGSGVAGSKLTNAWFDRQLGTVSTARNLKTCRTLLAMMDESPDG
jgi:uncharacterized protein (DUF1697 family)